MGSPLKRVVRSTNKLKSKTTETLAYSMTHDQRSNLHTLEFQLEDRNIIHENENSQNKESQVSRSYVHTSQNQLIKLKNSSQTMTFGKGSNEIGFVRDMSRKESDGKNPPVYHEVDEDLAESREFDDGIFDKRKNAQVVQSEVINRDSSKMRNESDNPINFDSFEPKISGKGGVIDKMSEGESKDVSDVSRPTERKENISIANSSEVDPIFKDDGDFEEEFQAKLKEEQHKCLDDFQMSKNIWKQHKIIKEKKSYDAVVL